jgi:hypothetical protein
MRGITTFRKAAQIEIPDSGPFGPRRLNVNKTRFTEPIDGILKERDAAAQRC